MSGSSRQCSVHQQNVQSGASLKTITQCIAENTNAIKQEGHVMI